MDGSSVLRYPCRSSFFLPLIPFILMDKKVILSVNCFGLRTSDVVRFSLSNTSNEFERSNVLEQLENVVDVLVVSHFGQIQVQFVAWISLYSSSETTAHWLCIRVLQLSHSMAGSLLVMLS